MYIRVSFRIFIITNDAQIMRSKIETARKTIDTTVTVMLYEQGDYVMAYCPALDLSSYASSEPEAKAAFKEALDIFIDYCEEQGTLEQNLLACGWKLRAGFLQPDEVHVPLQLLKAKNLHSFDQKVLLPVG